MVECKFLVYKYIQQQTQTQRNSEKLKKILTNHTPQSPPHTVSPPSPTPPTPLPRLPPHPPPNPITHTPIRLIRHQLLLQLRHQRLFTRTIPRARTFENRKLFAVEMEARGERSLGEFETRDQRREPVFVVAD